MNMQFYDNNFGVREGDKGGFDGILQRTKKIGFIKKLAPPVAKIYIRYWLYFLTLQIVLYQLIYYDIFIPI